jgi:membrane associated rhomboid family serine protease
MFFGFQHAKLSTSGAHVDDQVTIKYAAIPFEITHPGDQCDFISPGQIGCGPAGDVERVTHHNLPPTWLTIFTAMFMHGGLLHIAGNMLFLWIFGNNIEDSMNRFAFLGFYLLGGLVAMFAQTVFDPNAMVPTLGASGAIAAVLGAYALLYPRARVVTLVFIIFFVTLLRLPALIVLGGWFLLQLVDLSATSPSTGGGGGVAYLAHIGGFLFGLATIRLFATNVHDDYERPHRLPVY